jgi:hypothetical protein
MKHKTTVLAALMVFFLMSIASYAASQFEGTWKTQDSKGNLFEIVLSADGSAKGDRAKESVKGTWKEQGDSAMIDWGDGWTTKITKVGNGYKKTGFQNGKAEGEVAAEKVK